ncbi:hypothetical protein [Streptomyces sp. PsTaAH-124]|uniref:hypothetical protein n=1 Tax=Streptomyces sp. PsTaAH-124 TaxID=1157638 RepID=UPI00036C8A2A|nr:hypothetical protein [Streptomyces sp. PsTaAH-124]
MSPHLTTSGWVVVAGATTLVYLGATRWCMPTPRAKRSISFAPLGGSVFLVPTALVKGYSAALTLYLYSCVLLMLVIMLVPVRKRVAADILEQERNPMTKVPLNAVSVWWLGLSLAGSIAAMLYFWPSVE